MSNTQKMVLIHPVQAGYGKWAVLVHVVHDGTIIAWFCTLPMFPSRYDAAMWSDMHRRNQIALGVY
jgi:hypothetical protein